MTGSLEEPLINCAPSAQTIERTQAVRIAPSKGKGDQQTQLCGICICLKWCCGWGDDDSEEWRTHVIQKSNVKPKVEPFGYSVVAFDKDAYLASGTLLQVNLTGPGCGEYGRNVDAYVNRNTTDIRVCCPTPTTRGVCPPYNHKGQVSIIASIGDDTLSIKDPAGCVTLRNIIKNIVCELLKQCEEGKVTSPTSYF